MRNLQWWQKGVFTGSPVMFATEQSKIVCLICSQIHFFLTIHLRVLPQKRGKIRQRDVQQPPVFQLDWGKIWKR